MLQAEPAATPPKPNLSEFLDGYCFEQSEYGDLYGVVKSSKNLHFVKVGASDSGLIVLSEVLSAIDLDAPIPVAIRFDLG